MCFSKADSALTLIVSFVVGTLTHGLNCIPTTSKVDSPITFIVSFVVGTLTHGLNCIPTTAETGLRAKAVPIFSKAHYCRCCVLCGGLRRAGSPTTSMVNSSLTISFVVGTLTHGLNCIPTTAKDHQQLLRFIQKPILAVVVCCAVGYAGKDHQQPIRFIRKPILAVVVCCAVDYPGLDHQQLLRLIRL